MNRPFPRFLENDLEVCKSDEGVGRVLVVVMDLSQKKEQKTGCLDIQLGMRLSWLHRPVDFLCDDTYRCMVTRYGPFPKILEYMRIGVEVLCFSLREVDKRPVSPGQYAYGTVGCGVTAQFREREGIRNGREHLSPHHHQ